MPVLFRPTPSVVAPAIESVRVPELLSVALPEIVPALQAVSPASVRAPSATSPPPESARLPSISEAAARVKLPAEMTSGSLAVRLLIETVESTVTDGLRPKR